MTGPESVLIWTQETESSLRAANALSPLVTTRVLRTFQLDEEHGILLQITFTPLQYDFEGNLYPVFHPEGFWRPCCTSIAVESATTTAHEQCRRLSLILEQTGSWNADEDSLIQGPKIANGRNCRDAILITLGACSRPGSWLEHASVKGNVEHVRKHARFDVPTVSQRSQRVEPADDRRRSHFKRRMRGLRPLEDRPGSATSDARNPDVQNLPASIDPVETRRTTYGSPASVVRRFSEALRNPATCAIDVNFTHAIPRGDNLDEEGASELMADLLDRSRHFASALARYSELSVGCLLSLYKVHRVRRSTPRQRHDWKWCAEFASDVFREVVPHLQASALVVHRVLAASQRTFNGVSRLNGPQRRETATRVAGFMIQESATRPWWMLAEHFDIYGYLSSMLKFDICPKLLQMPWSEDWREKRVNRTVKHLCSELLMAQEEPHQSPNEQGVPSSVGPGDGHGLMDDPAQEIMSDTCDLFMGDSSLWTNVAANLLDEATFVDSIGYHA